jgi:hypothetical protein
MINLYLDPGSGSMLIQLVMASLAGLGLVIAAALGKILGLFHRDPPEDEDE